MAPKIEPTALYILVRTLSAESHPQCYVECFLRETERMMECTEEGNQNFSRTRGHCSNYQPTTLLSSFLKLLNCHPGAGWTWTNTGGFGIEFIFLRFCNDKGVSFGVRQTWVWLLFVILLSQSARDGTLLTRSTPSAIEGQSQIWV